MDISLAFFLILVIFFSLRGYRSGLLIIIARIISLLTAYAVALIFTQNVTVWLQAVSPIKGLIAYPIAGLLLFVATSGLLCLFSSLLLRQFKKNSLQENATRGRVISITGGLLGALVGAFIGIVVVWFFSTIQSVLQAKKELAPIAPSPFQQKVKQLVGLAVKGLINDATEQQNLASIATLLLINPAENIERLHRLSQASLMRDLLDSNAARAALDSSNPKALIRTPAFKKLVEHPDFIPFSRELKLSDKQVAIKITTLWSQVKQVDNNPQFKAILQDPKTKQLLQSRDIYAMLNSVEIDQLIKIISSVETPKILFNGDDLSSKKKATIHRWVDDKGVVHYSDRRKN